MATKKPIGYVIQENGCWDWVGTVGSTGHGQWWRGGRMHKAHRVVYEQYKGRIPKGLTLDHLCRNRACVNPNHLEAVTNRENILRGIGPTAQLARASHCTKGHPFDSANTRIDYRGRRKCRACNKQYDRAYRERANRRSI